MKLFFKFITVFLFSLLNNAFSQSAYLIKNYPETGKNNAIAEVSKGGEFFPEITPCEKNQVPISELLSNDTISKARQLNNFCAGEFLMEGLAYYNGEKIKIDKDLILAYDRYIRSVLTPCKNNVNPCLSSDVIFTDKKLADNVIECNDQIARIIIPAGGSYQGGNVCSLALAKIALIEIERAPNVLDKKLEMEIRRKLIKSNRLGNISALGILADIYRAGNFVNYDHLYAYQLIRDTFPPEEIKKLQIEDLQKIEFLEKKTIEQCLAAPQNYSHNPKLRCSATPNKLICDAYSKIDICAISLNNGRCSFAKSFKTFDTYNAITRKKSFDIGDKISFDIQSCNLLKVDFIFDSKNIISFEF